jgi:hypothetical protein
MPRYLDLESFEKVETALEHLFRSIHAPGDKVGVSGIYVCETCGRETFARANEPLPSEADCGFHKPSSFTSGEVRWRLVAATKDGCVDHQNLWSKK